MSPYHTVEIPKGVYGEASKIFEEVEEFRDGINQDNAVLQLCELSDLIGAIEAYTLNRFNISLEDLIKMKDLNRKAFQSGYRS